MKKTLGTTLAAALLYAAAAGATPVNVVSGDGAGKDLGTLLNSTWLVSGATTDVQGGQLTPDEVWQLTSTSASVNRLIFEFAGYAPSNSFGIYDTTDANCTQGSFAACRKLTVFNGAASSGAGAALDETAPGSFSLMGGAAVTFGSDQYGYFLSGPGGTFFSQSGLNEFGTDHMVAYSGQGQTMRWPSAGSSVTRTWAAGETLLAFEDLPTRVAGGKPGDWDYNDFIVMVNSVQSVPAVPEPATLGLLALGAGAVFARRRRAIARD